jgi:NTP pyrophosphatase (non-canonical NTP hydrolase)
MTPADFMQFVRERCRKDPREVAANAGPRQLEHAAFGLTSEAGEVASLCRRALVTGVDVHPANVVDECGDVLYNVALALDAVGYTLDDAMLWNTIKLARRAEHGKDKPAEAELLVQFMAELGEGRP